MVMRKTSQRQLVNEAFADVMRGIGSALKQTGIGQAIISDLSPITNLRKAFRDQQPAAVLKEKLKTDYFRIFDYKTVQIGKETKLPNDDKHDNRVSIPFKARLIKSVSKDTTTGKLVGGKEVLEDFTAILSRDRKGLSGNYGVEVIQDSSGNVIGTGKREAPDRIDAKTWNDIITDIQALTSFSLNDVMNVLTRHTGYTVKNINNYDGGNLKNNIASDISAGDKNLTKTAQYMRSKVLLEKHKQTQLQLIESSYNLIHELQINKGN
jgi:hypothetical protein